MSGRGGGVRPDTVHRNSSEQCSCMVFCLLLTKLDIHCLSYLGPSSYFPLAIQSCPGIESLVVSLPLGPRERFSDTFGLHLNSAGHHSQTPIHLHLR